MGMGLVRIKSLSPVSTDLRTRRPAGWHAKKLTDASCRERYGWESRKGLEFWLWTELGQVFFVFKRVKSYVLCIGVANIHVKKNQGLAFHRTGDRPEALLCPIIMKSVTKKHPSVWGFFFSYDGSPISLNFPWNSMRKSQNKGSLQLRADPMPITPPTISGPLGQVFCMPSSLSSASSMTGQIYLEERNVSGGEEEKEWVFAPESDNVVILVPYQVNTQSAKRATKRSVLPKSNESVRRAFFPELHHSSLRHPEALAPPPTPGWRLGCFGYRRRFF